MKAVFVSWRVLPPALVLIRRLAKCSSAPAGRLTSADTRSPALMIADQNGDMTERRFGELSRATCLKRWPGCRSDLDAIDLLSRKE